MSDSMINESRQFLEVFFDTIDTEEKAYWLGFIVADGHLDKPSNRVSIEISQRDEAHLYKFAVLLGLSLTRRSRLDKRTGSTYHTCQLRINSRKLVACLKAKGLSNHKTLELTSEILSCVPVDLRCHFIRGYFDGDGYVGIPKQKSRTKVVFSGTLHFLYGVKEIVEAQCKLQTNFPRKEKGCYAYTIDGTEKAIRLRDFLYTGSTLHLERKKQRFVSLGTLSKYRYITNRRGCWIVDLYHTLKIRPHFKTEEGAVKYALAMGLDIFREENTGCYRNLNLNDNERVLRKLYQT